MNDNEKECFKCRLRYKDGMTFASIDNRVIFKLFICRGCCDKIGYEILECEDKVNCPTCHTKLCGVCDCSGHYSDECKEFKDDEELHLEAMERGIRRAENAFEPDSNDMD